jgi:hypothetical protein
MRLLGEWFHHLRIAGGAADVNFCYCTARLAAPDRLADMAFNAGPNKAPYTSGSSYPFRYSRLSHTFACASGVPSCSVMISLAASQ